MGRPRWTAAIATGALLLSLGCSAGDDSADSTSTSTTAAVAVGGDAGPTTTVGPPWRVLLVGDSTLLAVESYDALSALQGFDSVYDAKSCRTIGIPSCGPRPKPPNTVDTIQDADGRFEAVVVMAGYDEWWTSFPDSFDDAVEAARAKGAKEIVWLTYTEGLGYVAPSGERAAEAFTKNNETLSAKVASGAYPDVVLADWKSYSAERPEWFTKDGIHLTDDGAYGVADYISRQVASLTGRPCPVPRSADGVVESPCPSPDAGEAVDDVRDLYDD